MLFLVRGTQTMLIGANTVVTLPDGDSHGITTVLEHAGEITFDVDRQQVKHFAVETPYLAAVVKGTNFTIRVDDEGGAVTVSRGLVEVREPRHRRHRRHPRRTDGSSRRRRRTTDGFGLGPARHHQNGQSARALCQGLLPRSGSWPSGRRAGKFR